MPKGGHRGGQHLAADARTPHFLAVAQRQRHHFGVGRAEQHQALAHARAAGQRQIQRHRPDHLAAGGIQGVDLAIGIGGVQATFVVARHQRQALITGTADIATPHGLYRDLLGHIAQFSRRIDLGRRDPVGYGRTAGGQQAQGGKQHGTIQRLFHDAGSALPRSTSFICTRSAPLTPSAIAIW